MDTNLSDEEMSELEGLLDDYAIFAEVFNWEANNGSLAGERKASDDKFEARQLIVEFCQKLKGKQNV